MIKKCKILILVINSIFLYPLNYKFVHIFEIGAELSQNHTVIVLEDKKANSYYSCFVIRVKFGANNKKKFVPSKYNYKYATFVCFYSWIHIYSCHISFSCWALTRNKKDITKVRGHKSVIIQYI